MTGKLTDGFQHLKGQVDLVKLQMAELAIAELYKMQARKIGDYPAKSYATGYDTVSGICEMLDRDDKEALYQVQKQIAQHQWVRGLFDKGDPHKESIADLSAKAIGCSASEVLIEGPGLFVSRPNDKRLKYKWHSEAHYYPKRRRFVNIWFPIFGDRTLADGAMSVLPKSHTEHWDFAEYTEGKNHFVQYEIPEAWLAGYEPYHCESKRGDLILFDRNLVHRSNVNATDKYSFSIVARAYTPRDDLTLSGSMSATPYGGDIGRANMVANR